MRGSDKHLAPTPARPRTRRAYRPSLEQIEERVLPGETAWWALPVSAGLFGPALADAFGHEEARGAHAARAESGTRDGGNAAGQSSPVMAFSGPGPAVAPARTAHAGAAPGANGTDDHALSATLIAAAAPPRVGRPVATQAGAGWVTYAHDAQHSGISAVPSQPMKGIRWQTPVDLMPHFTGDALLIHYGSPLVTAANTVIVPVKIHELGDYRVEARDGGTGALLWSRDTDYRLPPHSWIPSFSPTLTPRNELYFPGAGGTVYYRPNADDPNADTRHLVFYGIENYNPGLYDDRVFINTPITTDGAGNVYFGFQVTGPTPLDLRSGIARIGADGTGTWVAARDAAGDPDIVKVVHNSAPALSYDESLVYAAVRTANGRGGYLVALDSTTLAPRARAALFDPRSGQPANLPDDGSASPTVGWDGRVYFGVLENPFQSSKGWLLQFAADLSAGGTPGAFGWDNTPSVVPPWIVPSYKGSAEYLLMSKYNNYAGLGGDGVNRIAILDPDDTQIDPRTGVTVMKEVLTIAGPTPDPKFPPPAVYEWCINDAAVDPFTGSVIANSEDGTVYRWDLATNTFTEAMTLTEATGEAYTPTVIGADGTVYAINRATLFAVGLG